MSSPTPPPPSFDPSLSSNPFADDETIPAHPDPNPNRDSSDSASPLYTSEQTLHLQRQDTHLDHLSASIARQQQLSLQMGDELDLHHELLEDFDQQADRTGLRIGGASRRLETLRESVRDHGSIYIIVALIVVLVLLIALFK
ncbi:hypothetical protein ACQY0O_006933 [Thecaphora frezii]